LPCGAVDHPFECDVEPPETLPHPERAADGGKDPELGNVGRQIGAAGIVRADHRAAFKIDAAITAHVNAAADCGIERGAIGKRMACPVGPQPQLGGENQEC
jgi:hypothetical protein